MPPKRIIFIRHAQSEENVNVQSLFDCIKRVRSCRLPLWSDIKRVLKLLRFENDADVSTLGKRQIVDMGMILRDENFWESFKPDGILHSPLKRAKMTCSGLIKVAQESNVLVDGREICSIPVIEFPALVEASPLEHVFRRSLDRRIEEFENWILESPWENIIIVGHRQYFRRMLGQKLPLRNCDVWSFTADIMASSSRTKINWVLEGRLQRTHLADPHPLDAEAAAESENSQTRNRRQPHPLGDINQASVADNVENDLNENEPTCRICHMTKSEIPHLKMIKPCMCSGSLSCVHIKCLNEWRATSREAQFSCSVCKFEYRVTRSALAEMIMSENGAIFATVLLLLAAVVLLGTITNAATKALQFDLLYEVCILVHYLPWWRFCGSIFKDAVNEIFRDLTADFSGARALAQNMYELIRSPYIMELLICNSVSAAMIEILLLGLLAVGGLGFAHYLYKEITVALLDGAQGRYHLLMIAMFLCSLGTEAFVRFGVIIGCAIGAREMYTLVVSTGRRLAQSIGEQILEITPNANA